MIQQCSIPFTIKDGVLVIKACLTTHDKAKVNLNFVVDTGSTISLIKHDVAQKLDFTLKRRVDLLSISSSSGNRQGFKVLVPQLTLGQVTLRQIPIGVIDLHDSHNFHGILGLDILKNFNLSFDFTKQQMAISQNVPEKIAA